MKMVARKDILDYEASLPEEERFPENLDDYHIFSGDHPITVMNEFCNVLLFWSERIHKYFTK